MFLSTLLCSVQNEGQIERQLPIGSSINGRSEGEERGRRGGLTDPDYLSVLALHGEVQGRLLVDVLDVQASAALGGRKQEEHTRMHTHTQTHTEIDSHTRTRAIGRERWRERQKQKVQFKTHQLRGFKQPFWL